jgi:flagellar basal body-associated protein FliL
MSVGKKEENILETVKKAKKSPKIWIILIALGVIFLISLNIYYCYEVDILRSKVWQLGRYQTEL